MIDDVEGFAYYYTNYLSDDVGFYENELKKEHRRNLIAGDLYQRYNDYHDYSSSQLARDVEKTISLMPENTEIAVKDLKNALIREWYMDANYADKVIREVGTNDVRVSARNHAMDKSIGEIRLKKL